MRWQIFFLVRKDIQGQEPMTFYQPTLQEQSRSADRVIALIISNSSSPPMTEEQGEGCKINTLEEPELKLKTGGAQVKGRSWMFWAPGYETSNSCKHSHAEGF